MTKSPSRICSSIIESPFTRRTYVSRLPTSASGTVMVSVLVIASIGRPAAT